MIKSMVKLDVKNRRDLIKNAWILVNTCGRVYFNEEVLIITDGSTVDVGNYLYKAVRKITDNVAVMSIVQSDGHGIEPSAEVAKAMYKSDVIFAVTCNSMAHTRARKRATDKGARYLSLADYSIEQLARPSIDVDYLRQAKLVRRIMNKLNNVNNLEISSVKGTKIKLEISGRKANYCPGFCHLPGMLGSPPDIETNIAPLEDKSQGVLMVDGSIPCSQIGLVEKDILIKIDKGLIVGVDENTEQGRILKNVLDIKSDFKRGVLAEFGIGLNPRAQLCGLMLEDEGCLGTVHFGFGSNHTIGGSNNTNFHLDFVIIEPTVLADEEIIMKQGKLLLND